MVLKFAPSTLAFALVTNAVIGREEFQNALFASAIDVGSLSHSSLRSSQKAKHYHDHQDDSKNFVQHVASAYHSEETKWRPNKDKANPDTDVGILRSSKKRNTNALDEKPKNIEYVNNGDYTDSAQICDPLGRGPCVKNSACLWDLDKGCVPRGGLGVNTGDYTDSAQICDPLGRGPCVKNSACLWDLDKGCVPRGGLGVNTGDYTDSAQICDPLGRGPCVKNSACLWDLDKGCVPNHGGSSKDSVSNVEVQSPKDVAMSSL